MRPVFGDWLAALVLLADPDARRAMLIGTALSGALLVAAFALFLGAIDLAMEGTLALPMVGDVTGVGSLLSPGALLNMLAASVVLMLPVAPAFAALFLDDVARAVEARRWPALAPAGLPRGAALREGAAGIGLLVVANLLASFVFPVAGLFAPLVFWVVNGYLMGRVFFRLTALRHMARPQALRAVRIHRGEAWFAGTLLAALLTVPVVNLFAPALGAAAFVHLLHRRCDLSGRESPAP